MIPSLRRLGRRAVFQHNDPKHTSKTTTALLKKLRVKVICGASSNRRWKSTRSLTSTSSVMSSWRSGRGHQSQPVKLWWTPCPRGLRQCWKIMMATQNIDTLGPIWTFSFRGVLTFVASGLDINSCVFNSFEGTANLHCYASCTLTTLHCIKVSFLQCCHMKRYNKIFTKMWGVYSLLWDTVYIYIYIYIYICHISWSFLWLCCPYSIFFTHFFKKVVLMPPLLNMNLISRNLHE